MPKIGMEPLRRADAINAALECICDFGIDQITLDMVAARAGFSKGIINYYFKSKKMLIIDSLKAFLIASMTQAQHVLLTEKKPLQMLKRIVELSLPNVDTMVNGYFNVTCIDQPDKINLPLAKVEKLMVQFVSKVSHDDEFKSIMQESFISELEGITELLGLIKQTDGDTDIDIEVQKAAYTLLTIIYGLNFFRMAGFILPNTNSSRQIAFDYINIISKESNSSGKECQ